jgi:sigma-54-specific transcriptional regulator
MSESNPARLLPFRGTSGASISVAAKALVSSDPRSEQVLRRLERVAPSEASVLIVGDTGTGKELAARYLHERSRRTGPFVAVNCAAFNENLVESELFGHEAGAFTGAAQARAGWFEAANGGTLFLDEIGDMPLYLQVKLLRVLQERQVARLGSRKHIPIDVRVVAATNVDLSAAVEAGRFRRDLYYRLNVASVRLLPLRERPGDILPLARHFIDYYRRKLDLGSVELSASAERRLLSYGWPGNIRELENVVHHGLILCQGGVIEAEDLGLEPELLESAPAAADLLEGLTEELRILLQSERGEVYESVERLLVTTAFEHCDRNQVRTAKRLGISRNVVRAQLKRYGLISEQMAAG